MLFSHSFGSLETMNRARYWLTWHGYTVHEAPAAADASVRCPRLALTIRPAARAAVQALIDSIEHADPTAWPAFRDSTTGKRWIADGPATHTPHGTPIHWQSSDEATTDPSAARVAEYMFSRWE